MEKYIIVPIIMLGIVGILFIPRALGWLNCKVFNRNPSDLSDGVESESYTTIGLTMIEGLVMIYVFLLVAIKVFNNIF